MLNPLQVLTLPYIMIIVKSIQRILTCWFCVIRLLVMDITVSSNIYKICPTKSKSTGSYQLDVVYKCCRCVALLGNSDTFQPKLMFYAEDHNYGFVKFVHNLFFEMHSRNGMYFISCTMNFSDAFRLQVVVTTIVEELKN